MRGRNNNNNNNNSNNNGNNGNRKAPNPLQRSYESNGPDVKVRGTAQNVAEKYLQLARDAQSSGDPVAAENYFQHAEHYYRILLAGQEQMAQQFGHSFPPNRAFSDEPDDGEEDGDEDGASFQPGLSQAGAQQPDLRHQPQPGPNGNGYAGNGGARPDGESNDGQSQNGQRFDRQPRQNDRNPNQDRAPNQDRPNQDRQNGDRNGNRRFDRNDRQERGEPRRFERQEGGQNGQGGYQQPRFEQPAPIEQPDGAPVQTQPAQNQGERRPDRVENAPRPERAERRPRRERPQFEDEGHGDVVAALPSFLTTPVRVPIAVVEEPEAAPVAVAQVPPESAAVDDALPETAPKKPRGRRRSPREVMDALGSDSDTTIE